MALHPGFNVIRLSLVSKLLGNTSGKVPQKAITWIWKWSESEVTQSCPTLCDPMDCSLPGSSIHGIFPERILEWVAISFSRGSFWPRGWTWVSHIAGRLFEPPGNPQLKYEWSQYTQLYQRKNTKTSKICSGNEQAAKSLRVFFKY